jgi:hypothetical protein
MCGFRSFRKSDSIPSVSRNITAPDSENQVIYRQGIRHVARLGGRHSTKTSSTSKLEKIRSDSSYLITGGLGALGLKVADWMVSQGAKYLKFNRTK